MRGTFIYDITTIVGIVLMIFVITYWGVQFGSEQIANIFLSDPSALQGSLAGATSFSCRPYEYTFTLNAPMQTPADIVLADKTLEIIPPSRISERERGGSITYKGEGPSTLIRCSGITIETSSIKAEKSSSSKFVVEKKNNKVSVKVK